MRLFAKKVRDPEVCFCQNVVEVLGGLSNATTNVAWIAIAKNVLTKRGLMDIIHRHADNLAGYIVEECYPSNRHELLNHAEALFEIATSGIDWKMNTGGMLALGRVTKKMGLYESEKKKLIIKYMLDGEDSNVNDIVANEMLSLF